MNFIDNYRQPNNLLDRIPEYNQIILDLGKSINKNNQFDNFKKNKARI